MYVVILRACKFQQSSAAVTRRLATSTLTEPPYLNRKSRSEGARTSLRGLKKCRTDCQSVRLDGRIGDPTYKFHSADTATCTLGEFEYCCHSRLAMLASSAPSWTWNLYRDTYGLPGWIVNESEDAGVKQK